MIANIGAFRFHIGLMITICTSTPTMATRTMLTKADTADRPAEPHQHRMGEHAAEHDEDALREIDDAAGVVDDAEADGDEPIDEPDADAADEALDQFDHARHAPSPRCPDRRR